MAAKLVAGDRCGGKVLVVGGFKCHKDKTCADHLSWRCWRRRTCKARIRTRLFDLNDQTPNIRVIVGGGGVGGGGVGVKTRQFTTMLLMTSS